MIRFEKKLSEYGRGVVHMSLKDITLPVEYDVDPLCNFQIDTYAVLKPKSSDFSWNAVFGPVHSFLDTLNEKDQTAFAMMIIVMHYKILQTLGTDAPIDGALITQLETDLSRMLADFDQQTHCFDKLLDFTESHIPIQSFAGVGERAQDSVEMTFYRDDVVKLTAVTILCKMLTVIFGTFIESCKKRMDNSYKEIHCVAILKHILENNCRALIEKFLYFISRIAKPMLTRVNLTHLYNGFTFNMIIQQIYAFSFTRRAVAVDLFKPEGNLVTYFTSCIRASAQTQFSSSGFKTNVAEIKSPNDKPSSEDDGNVSNLETESRASSKTADFQVLIKAALIQLTTRFPEEYDLDQELIEKLHAYYEFNHIALTPMNHYVLGIVFGNYLGGAKSVEMLDGVSLNKILPVLQAYLYQQGYLDLLHVVSAVPTGQVKAFVTGSDTQLRATWNSSFEYRNVDQMFPIFVSDFRWDSGLKNIQEELTTMNYLYNTGPALWEKLGDEIKNGEVLVTPESVCRSICSLIAHTIMPQVV